MSLTQNNDRLTVAEKGCESASVSPTQSSSERQVNMTISRTAPFSAQPASCAGSTTKVYKVKNRPLSEIFQRRGEREKYRFIVGDEVTSLKFHGVLRASQRLLTSSPTCLSGVGRYQQKLPPRGAGERRGFRQRNGGQRN